MNYGRKKAAKKRRDITSKSKMKKKRLGVRIFKGVLLTLLLLMVAGCVGGGIFLKKVIDSAPDVTPEDVKPTGYTSVVYASDNKTETQRLTSAGSNRVYKTIDEIPKDLQHAFVAIEDERFYEHNGIDPKGIVRAGMIGLTTGDFSQGASTLTQQLIKNNIFDFMSEDTFFDRLERKIQEQYLALKLEKQMSKSEIMENYLNTINLGQNTLGVQAASRPSPRVQATTIRSLTRITMRIAASRFLKTCWSRDTFPRRPMTRRWPMMSMPASRMSIRTSRRTRLLRATS